MHLKSHYRVRHKMPPDPDSSAYAQPVPEEKPGKLRLLRNTSRLYG
jgi:hypothetical protein